MKIIEFEGKLPKIDDTAFIADTAVIIGDVTIGAHSSVWYGTVIRGDVAPVVIGNHVNIQENSVIHESALLPVKIEDHVTVGHMCILHSCTIRKNSLIGMGSILLDNVEIEEECLIGAGSLLSGGKRFESGQLILGRPGKPIRPLTDEEKVDILKNAEHYVEKANYYKSLQGKD